MRRDRRFAAVLLDRDGTLVENVPYNGDPGAVRPVPGVREALDRLRAAGVRLGVVSNQSGIARGLLTAGQVERVNARVEELLGPFGSWQVCPHDAGTRCGCRKPRPGMVLAAARALGVPPERCVMVGDIGADVRAGLAAGAAAVLVPTPETLPGEVAEAGVVAADLPAAAAWILAARDERPGGPRVLAVRSDSAGDVLLTGPALRAVAERARHVTLLCGPRGRAAAELLPGVGEVVEWCAPWIDARPPAVRRDDVGALVARVGAGRFDEAVIFTSFHQSPLPMALLLRLAGVPRIAAISVDYPGSLLDVRHRVDEGLPEAERARSLASAAGFPPAPWDDGRLRLRPGSPPARGGVAAGYVVVHPGASVPARACPPERCREIVAALVAAGHRVVVTGGRHERDLTASVSGGGPGMVDLAGGGPGVVDLAGGGPGVVDLGGRTDLAGLAAVLADADAAVVANTGPAHLAAAVGTPVVSLFAPTVPYRRWGPYGVPAVRLGDPDAPCRGSRATTCPVPGHPCLSTVEPAAVVRAVADLTGGTRALHVTDLEAACAS